MQLSDIEKLQVKNNYLDPLVYLECLKIISERDQLEESQLNPVMINEIMSIEDELGTNLPELYEDFLIKVGAGSEHGGLAYWHHLDLTRPGNILQLNKHNNQQEKRTPLKDFLSVYNPCDGTLIGFNRKNGDYSEQVFLWSEDEQELEPLFDNFDDFLKNNIDCSPDELEEAERRVTDIV